MMSRRESERILPGRKIGNFIVGRKLGTGAFSAVHLASHNRTKQSVALKILDGKKIEELQMTTERVWREIINLRLCAGHPHIIRLYDVYEKGSVVSDTVLVTEYADGGTLYDYVTEQRSQRLSVRKSRYLLQQIVSGLDFMHYRGIAHRDLTLDNILMDTSRSSVKLADFGFSRCVPQEGRGKMITSCGSPNYAAPELLNEVPYNGMAVDVWSLGVVLYVMLNGFLPFDEEKYPDLFKKIRAGIYHLPWRLPREAKELFPLLFKVDPFFRIKLPELRNSTFCQIEIPDYLNESPETIYMNWKNKKTNVNSEVVDQVLEYYNTSSICQKDKLKNNCTESFENYYVTRKLVEQVAAAFQEVREEQPSAILRDLQTNYDLILDKKHETVRKTYHKKNIMHRFFSSVAFISITTFALNFRSKGAHECPKIYFSRYGNSHCKHIVVGQA